MRGAGSTEQEDWMCFIRCQEFSVVFAFSRIRRIKLPILLRPFGCKIFSHFIQPACGDASGTRSNRLKSHKNFFVVNWVDANSAAGGGLSIHAGWMSLDENPASIRSWSRRTRTRTSKNVTPSSQRSGGPELSRLFCRLGGGLRCPLVRCLQRPLPGKGTVGSVFLRMALDASHGFPRMLATAGSASFSAFFRAGSAALARGPR